MNTISKFRIPLSEPSFGGNEQKYLSEAIRSTWVSTQGPYLEQFERAVKNLLDCKYAVATSNGTSALHTALLVAGVQSEDEVLVPALTFVATANTVRYCQAHPVFMDIDYKSWGMDPIKVRTFLLEKCRTRKGKTFNRSTGRRVSAIVPVHTLGHPVDMDPLIEIAKEFNLALVEDACEALGACYKGKPVGGLGDLGCLSFNGNKVITSGGGGMIVTQRNTLADRARYLTTQAKDDPEEYIHNEVGYNYRLTNLQAALGCAQMEQLPKFLKKKSEIARRYREAFANIRELTCMPQAPWASPTYWLFTVLVNVTQASVSKDLVQFLASHGVVSRRLWRPLHLLPMYRKDETYKVRIAEDLYAKAVSLPSSPSLAEPDQEKVIQLVLEFVKRL